MYLLSCIALLQLLAVITADTNSKFRKEAGAKYKIEEISRRYGYILQTHKVVTPDGYILTIHRISVGEIVKRKYPVLLIHGCMATSMFWMLNTVERALPSLLANAGYDVWLGNTRGNSYSSNHTEISINSTEFWDFSFDEMGKYDLPAMIDYILNICKKKHIHYIGHSQGTTSFFAMASDLEEYDKKIISMHALSPVVFFGSFLSQIPFIKTLSRTLVSPGDIITNFGKRPIFEIFPLMAEILANFCKTISEAFCYPTIYKLAGFANVDKRIMNSIAKAFPDNTSIKSIIHFIQMFNSGLFQKFDYGSENFLKYGQATPPQYNLSKISTPIFLYNSRFDHVLPLDGGIQLSLTLSRASVYLNLTIPDKYKFMHADYLFAKNVKKLVYNIILKNISSLDSSN